MLRRLVYAIGLAAALRAVPQLAAQQADPAWEPIATEGVLRASALVDSVYVDRQLRQATVDGGDFTAYLMARLGIRTLPPDFGYRVLVDSTMIRIGGRIADLPPDARRALAQLVLVLPPATRLEAQMILLSAGREAVRFHLAGATVQGIPVPQSVLDPLMASVGRQYPALTETGRDLFVQVPPGGKMALVAGGVRLTAP
jgi:hypothetical protein